MIYLLTAIGWPPGGTSTVHIYTHTHTHTQNTQNDTKQTIHRTKQKFWKSTSRAPSFCHRLSEPQGHNATGTIMPMKNSNDTVGNPTHGLPTCSKVPHPTAPPRAAPPPQLAVSEWKSCTWSCNRYSSTVWSQRLDGSWLLKHDVKTSLTFSTQQGQIVVSGAIRMRL